MFAIVDDRQLRVGRRSLLSFPQKWNKRYVPSAGLRLTDNTSYRRNTNMA